jgi:DNA-binding NarL/FixJ family response regulator
MEGFKDFFRHAEQGWSDQEIINIYLSTPEKKIQELSHETGKSVGEIYRILHNNQITPNRLRTNHQNVLDFAASGMSVIQIAELTGYTPRNVRYILAKLTEQNGRNRS